MVSESERWFCSVLPWRARWRRSWHGAGPNRLNRRTSWITHITTNPKNLWVLLSAVWAQLTSTVWGPCCTLGNCSCREHTSQQQNWGQGRSSCWKRRLVRNWSLMSWWKRRNSQRRKQWFSCVSVGLIIFSPFMCWWSLMSCSCCETGIWPRQPA